MIEERALLGQTAEEIADAALAERMAAFVDTVRARYAALPVPAYAAS